jgi:hypothetical protein
MLHKKIEFLGGEDSINQVILHLVHVLVENTEKNMFLVQQVIQVMLGLGMMKLKFHAILEEQKDLL